MEKFITIQEAAKREGVNHQIIYRRYRAGEYDGARCCECKYTILIPTKPIRGGTKDASVGDMLTVREAAKEAGVNPSAIFRRYQAGKFKKARRCTCGHSIMLPGKEIETYIQERESNKNPR